MTDILLTRPFINRMGVRPAKPTVATVIQFMCERHHLSKGELLTGRGSAWIWKARQEAYWRARHEAKAKLSMIARLFHKDVTTVRHGIEMHGKRMGAGNGTA